jgi:hypothetical protein
MNVNGRLTTRLLEAVTVTKSVCDTLPQDATSKAGGFSLDTFPFTTGSGLRDERGLGLARVSAWMHRKIDSVSATQFLSVGGGAASGL